MLKNILFWIAGISFLAISICGYSKSSKKLSEIIIVQSCSMGDYFWISGSVQHGKSFIEKNYLMNTEIKKDQDICPNTEGKKIVNGKRIKITTIATKICEHTPPCEKGDSMTPATAIVSYEILEKK